MPVSTTTTTSGTSTNGRSRPAPLMVILKLSPKFLARFPHNSTETKDNSSSPTKEKETSPASSSAEPVVPPSSVDNASDAGSTPATGMTPADTPRRKGIPGPKPGSKRGLNQGEVHSKPRGKPGPKKKPRLEDGTIDHGKLLPPGHKLGPKANTGAINAGLRALDRTGAPCRKWERKPLQLKSFTGTVWQLPTWRAPKPPKVDENGEAKDVAISTGDSDSKANNSASGVPSEKSTGDGDLTPLPGNMVESSSPAIAMAA